MDFNDNELSRMSRRRFLRVASAMGVSASALHLGTQEGLVAAADENEVPYVHHVRNTGMENGEVQREKVYASIHRDEWEVRHTAKDAAEKIGQRIVDEGWPTSLVAPTWGVAPNSAHGFGVQVDYRTLVANGGSETTPGPSYDEVRRKLPNTVQGEVPDGNGGTHRRAVPVRVVRGRDVKTACQNTANPASPDIPQGFAIVDENNGEKCSNAGSFYHDTYGYGTISSGHAFTSTGHRGKCDGIVFGYCKDRQNGADIDWAFINDANESMLTNLTSGDGTSVEEDIAGRVSDATLKNDVGGGYDYYTQGRATCSTLCEVQSVNGFGDSWVRVNSNVDYGDSGGSLWKYDSDGDALIAGVIVSNYFGDCKATTAETTENKAGGNFY